MSHNNYTNILFVVIIFISFFFVCTDDPIKVVSNKKTAGKSLFKIIYDLFTCDKTAALFYTNDIKVLIDIIVRQLNDLSPGDEVST